MPPVSLGFAARKRQLLLALALLLFACEEPVVPNDPGNAALYRSCQEKDWRSCVALGKNYENGTRVGWRPERAIALYEKACAAGYADGCQQAGFFLERGHAQLYADGKRAARYLKKACDAGLLGSCVELANLYDHGPIRHERRRAAQLYESTCARGVAESCLRAGAMYRGGNGVASNTKKASALFKLGCDGGNGRACTFLSEHYFIGWGVPRNASAGWSYLQKGCALREATACEVVAAAMPVDTASAAASRRAWKRVIAAPAPDSLFANARSYDEVIRRIDQLHGTYARIDLDGVHPELAQYVEAWKTWSAGLRALCERQRRQEQTANDVEVFSGLVGAWLEKNDRGDRDEESLDRGMAKGSEAGRSLAGALGAAANRQLAADGEALGRRARQLVDYQDALAIRMEMVYRVGFPPPAAGK
jgi:TPR repeat protein